MRLAYHVMSSPLGLLFLAASEHGLRYLEFMDRKSLKRMFASHAAQEGDTTWEPSLLELKPVVDQLEAYFSGSLERFDLLLDPVGPEFHRAVWRALGEVPFGQTRTYGEIAKAIGQPRATRAVGLANRDNPLAIVIPCHRVIGASGSLTGYGGGLQRKRWLLQHEARFAVPSGPQGELFAPGAGAPAPAALASAPPAARLKPRRAGGPQVKPGGKPKPRAGPKPRRKAKRRAQPGRGRARAAGRRPRVRARRTVAKRPARRRAARARRRTS